MGLDSVLRGKRDEILRIATSHRARDVRIFGSVARGDSGPNSDIDILVKLDHGRSLLDIIAIKQGVEDVIGREVDIVTIAVATVAYRGADPLMMVVFEETESGIIAVSIHPLEERMLKGKSGTEGGQHDC